MTLKSTGDIFYIAARPDRNDMLLLKLIVQIVSAEALRNGAGIIDRRQGRGGERGMVEEVGGGGGVRNAACLVNESGN